MRRLARALVAAITIAACAIQPDAGPRDIPADDQLAALRNEASDDIAEGTNRIYLLTPPEAEQRQQLRSVQRAVGDDADDLLESLFAGPNEDELEQQLGTAIPPGIESFDTRAVGRVLTIDIEGEPFVELTADALSLALAQIVATASELDGVRRVRLRVDGEIQAWPTGNGELSQNPLSVFDYPGVLETSQPPFPAVPDA